MFSLEGGQAAANRLLNLGVTGIVCASDPLALGAIRAVRRRGRSVPDDVSVVGYDDSAFMNCTDPPLTTVRQPIEAIGKTAVALLASSMEGAKVAPEELFYEPELVVRAPPRGPASPPTTDGLARRRRRHRPRCRRVGGHRFPRSASKNKLSSMSHCLLSRCCVLSRTFSPQTGIV